MSGRLPGSLFIGAMLLAGLPHAALAAPTEDPPGRPWTTADFGGVLSVGLEGHRNYQAGLTNFRKLCAHCHALGKHGGGTATDLTRQALTYTPEELLGHLLSSSQHRQHRAPKGGLLDSLTQAGVLDLLAFVLSGAAPQSPFFFNP
jgi:mono/diheme cytochrome c family protein